MSTPNAKFNQPIVGQFQKSSSIYSVLFGTDAVLLENELNEMQWIQIEKVSSIFQNLYTSGIIDKIDINKVNNDIVLKNTQPTKPISFLIDGFFLDIGGQNLDDEVKIDTSSTLFGVNKNIVFLEAWFETVDGVATNNLINKFGGNNNSNQIAYEIKDDERLSKETTRRIQMRWKVRIIKDTDLFEPTSVASSINSSFYQPTLDGSIFVSFKDTNKKINENSYAIPLVLFDKSSSTISNISPKISTKTTGSFVDGEYSDVLTNKIGVTKLYLEQLISDGNGLIKDGDKINIQLANNSGLKLMEGTDSGLSVDFGTTNLQVARGKHVHLLEDLTNFNVSSPTVGQVLRYNDVSGKWENFTNSTLDIIPLEDLSNVKITSPTTGQTLRYNALAPDGEKWSNGALLASDISAAPSTHVNSTDGHPNATITANGFMSSGDKIKLNGIANSAVNVKDSTTNGNIVITSYTGAESELVVYDHPDVDGYKHVPASVNKSGQFLKALNNTGDIGWVNPVLNNLDDVAIVSETSGQVLMYDTVSTAKWKNKSLGSLASLDLASSSGLINDSGLKVNIGTEVDDKGLKINTNKLQLNLDTEGGCGLVVNSNGLKINNSVVTGTDSNIGTSGLVIDSNNDQLKINIGQKNTDNEFRGLKINANQLQINLADTNSGLLFDSTGIKVDPLFVKNRGEDTIAGSKADAEGENSYSATSTYYSIYDIYSATGPTGGKYTYKIKLQPDIMKNINNSVPEPYNIDIVQDDKVIISPFPLTVAQEAGDQASDPQITLGTVIEVGEEDFMKYIKVEVSLQLSSHLYVFKAEIVGAQRASHAEGIKTIASWGGAHAEGVRTLSTHFGSHAEGFRTHAAGPMSHAEGSKTISGVHSSHAEGYLTLAARGDAYRYEIITTAGNPQYGNMKLVYNINGDSISGTSASTFDYRSVFPKGMRVFIKPDGKQPFVITLNSTPEYSATNNATYINHGKQIETSGTGWIITNYEDSSWFDADVAASHSEGIGTIAINVGSHAQGFETIASGKYSHAGGMGTVAKALQHVIGKYNTALGSNDVLPTGETYTDTNNDIFIIGNGTGITSSERSNAIEMTMGGKIKCKGALVTSTTGDYAEMFEWLDGNPNDEDRVGYFVTIDENSDKIKKANQNDTYVLGIVSSTPAIIGDGGSMEWKNRYVKDVWGRTIYQDVVIPAIYNNITKINGDGEEFVEQILLEPERIEKQPILNPEYRPSLEYVPRENRKEWSPIGMVGKLYVRDDGTCAVGGYCKANSNGIATISTDGYRVIQRVSEDVIRVILK